MYDQVIPYITIGIGADVTAADDVTSIVGNNALLSNPSEILDAYYTIDSILANYEGDGIPTAVSYGMVAPPLDAQDPPPRKGVWSRDIVASDGTIDWNLTITLSQPHSTALSLYFDGTDVSGTVDFTLNGVSVRTIPMSSTDGVFVYDKVVRYDTMTIRVTRGTVPYMHVKLAELEFGATRTLSSSELCDTINVIQETDLLQSSIPLHELDFSLINVDGKYDLDNLDEEGINKDLERIAIGVPVTLSFTLIDGDVQSTHVIGRYTIAKHNAEEESLQITAYDYRAVLQNKTSPVYISTTTELATSISSMLSVFHVPHIVDDNARFIYPTHDYIFDEDTPALDQLLYIQQMYQIFVVPERDGMLHIQYGEPRGTVTPLTQDVMTSYPKPSLTTSYNYITIEYGPKGNKETFNYDLRKDPNELVGALVFSNPLIQTQAEAEELAMRIKDRIFTQKYLAEAIGDPDFRVGQSVAIEGRFSAGSPFTYRIQMLEMEYDGGLTMRVEGVR